MGKFNEFSEIQNLDSNSVIEKAISEIDELCIWLFDRWCEQRNVIPLAYLMHTWPVASQDPYFYKRLSNTLDELVTFHCDSLSLYEREMVHDLKETAMHTSAYLAKGGGTLKR